MAPAQPSVKPDPDLISFSKAAAPMPCESSFARSSGKVLSCMSNPEDLMIEVENGLDERDNDVSKVVKKEDSDATEYSSSFDGTLSGAENCSGLSDAEVESGFYGENNMSFDDFSNIFPAKKKKLTSHWRNFINPLRWRCKWAELRIREFQSQAAKYARELAAYEQRKQLPVDHAMDGSKSLPFSSQHPGKKAMERRKRKRLEDTVDVASFMSQHNLFSYHENKRSDSDGVVGADDSSNPEQNNGGKEEVGIIDGCSFHEQTLDHSSFGEILLKIETVQLRVQKLKSQLVGMIGENSLKLSSSENLNLLMPGELQNSSAPSPTFSACNGDTHSLGTLNAPSLHISEYDIGEFVLPDSAMSNYGEGLFIPDIIESTVSLLSSIDVTLDHPEIGDTCEAIMDNVHIHNQALETEAERYTVKMEQEPLVEKQAEPQGSGQESSNPCTFPSLEADTVSKPCSHLEQSALTSCLASDINFPISKRKRGERKAGSGGWNK